eukprot:4291814-Pleurochrysis_carterae.AAC.1
MKARARARVRAALSARCKQEAKRTAPRRQAKYCFAQRSLSSDHLRRRHRPGSTAACQCQQRLSSDVPRLQSPLPPSFLALFLAPSRSLARSLPPVLPTFVAVN